MKTGKGFRGGRPRYVRKKITPSKMAEGIANKDVFVGQMIDTVEALARLSVNKKGQLIATGVARGRRKDEIRKDELGQE